MVAFLQSLLPFLTLIATIVTTLYGYDRVTKTFEARLVDAIRGKVDVALYAAKTKELHDKNNELAIAQAVLHSEVNSLKNNVAMLTSLLLKKEQTQDASPPDPLQRRT